jgi:hypothetical protein
MKYLDLGTVAFCALIALLAYLEHVEKMAGLVK